MSDYDQFPFELSEFQKKSINAIKNGDHSLVTAHTGSGKTVPAEFAINYFHKLGKKIIYTTPIKALSNQKLYDMRLKFPDIDFGILTGDSKDNPGADVLIMTTEILRNTLFNKCILNQGEQKNIPLHFDMDIENDLALVVFDEVHYIADEGRGEVWEQSILLLPPKVQLLMLSATIHKPEDFAMWVETEKKKQGGDKRVVLSSTNERVVPLTHYGWLSTTKATYKTIKGTDMEQTFIDNTNKLLTLKNSNGEMHDANYNSLSKMKGFLSKKNIYVNRSFLLNKLISYMLEQDMLPALCFVFSRKQVEVCADEINISLFDEDSDIPSKIAKECDKLLRNKISNFAEYMELPEYRKTIALLQRGIAIHHAGVMPILREMTEMLFEKKYIKVLFATETFAVGINMPTKSVIFTGLMKYNGTTMRLLYSNEYTQMAGRAGRRGIDTVGHVIHCNNLFDIPTFTDYKKILAGAPKELKSQFKISYHVILNIISTNYGKTTKYILGEIVKFMESSMIQSEIEQEIAGYKLEIEDLTLKLERKEQNIQKLTTPSEILHKYYSLITNLKYQKKNLQKKTRKEMRGIEIKHLKIKDEVQYLDEVNQVKEQLQTPHEYTEQAKVYIESNILTVLRALEKKGFIQETECEDPRNKTYTLTNKGIIATHIQELHCLAIADLYDETNGFADFTSEQLIGLFSCFTNVSVKDDTQVIKYEGKDTLLNVAVLNIKHKYDTYYDFEGEENIHSGIEYKIHFELIDVVLNWCKAKTETECLVILEDLKSNKDIFLGEFIKAILKINNIASEFESICEILNNISLLKKIKEISAFTMKYIVNNQSLYI